MPPGQTPALKWIICTKLLIGRIGGRSLPNLTVWPEQMIIDIHKADERGMGYGWRFSRKSIFYLGLNTSISHPLPSHRRLGCFGWDSLQAHVLPQL
jgi:hypothetical protein